MPSALAHNGAEGPIVKRQKISNGEVLSGLPPVRRSRLFAPFRTVGLVSSTSVPFTSIPLGKNSFQVTTSVGRCLQTYDLKRGLNLIFLTRPQTPAEITATLAYKDQILAAWHDSAQDSGPGIWIFKRGKRVQELRGPGDLTQAIKQIITFGTWIVGCCSTRIEIWRSETLEHYTTLYSTTSSKRDDDISCICNMPTYLNKIFAGRKDGSVDIWNVSTGKLIYTILPPSSNSGAVTALQPSPALSLLAIAYSKGALILHDVCIDRIRIRLHSDTPITSISFRSDGLGAGEDGRKDGVCATAGPNSGDVTFWDLNNGGRIMGILRGAHYPPLASGSLCGGGINKVEFLPGQPVILTSGLDNSLKSWIFDETPFSPIPRILHSRSGHAASITRLHFLPSDADGVDAGGKWLLSAGKDQSLWGWSLRRDGQSTELSQGNIKKKAKKHGILTTSALTNEPGTALEDLKAPEIICIASCLNRDGGMGAFSGIGKIWQKGGHAPRKPIDASQSANTGWESVVTGHKGDKYARTWFWGRKKAGRWALETGDGSDVSSVAISPCGTFAVIGSQGGGIDMFNLQSGLRRQRFPTKLTPAQARKLKLQLENAQDPKLFGNESKYQPGLGKHTNKVTGLAVDSLNRTLISSSLDGKVKFWEFGTSNLVDEVNWYPMVGITGLRYHPQSDLIAVTCDDLSIRVVDIETKKTIRELWGCNGGITDYCFSNDGRWIIAASDDKIIRVWDLPTGHLIDAIRLAKPCYALAFSGTGEFLATACEGDAGVDIWNNRTLFKHVPTRHITEYDIAELQRPTTSGETSQGLLEGAFEDTEIEILSDGLQIQSLDQLSNDMMTLSLVPKSRWQSLLHLDLIKQRNKPKEAPKVPERAPFFLPSLENGKPAIETAVIVSEDSKTERSRIIKMERSATEGVFTIALREGRLSGNYDVFVEHLKALSPSAADLEIRSLNASDGTDEFVAFVNALTARLSQKRDYELVQAWMSVFLRLHSETIAHDTHLIEALRQWKGEQHREGRRLGELVGYCGGVIGFLRSPRT